MAEDSFVLAEKIYASRLLVGTGRYKTLEETACVIEASGAEIITVAVRRVNLTNPNEPRLSDVLPPERYTYLPNSAGCYTAEEAVRVLSLAREAGGWNLVKLEVIGDKQTLLPDAEETLKAARTLVKDGFSVMAYTNDDPITARKLEDAGCAAVMPLAAPIGSGRGIQNRLNLELILRQSRVPIIVDAGIGTASDATIAMEMGCAGVLLNTAISDARSPLHMAQAMKHAVCAGRLAFLAGRMETKTLAAPSSPEAGKITANG